uniref:Uncharacterized protein n=1 Tax=Cacopsylla melanoneura TaxID=428564 RepID=A0A8D8XTQ3_9HEMI
MARRPGGERLRTAVSAPCSRHLGGGRRRTAVSAPCSCRPVGERRRTAVSAPGVRRPSRVRVRPEGCVRSPVALHEGCRGHPRNPPSLRARWLSPGRERRGSRGRLGAAPVGCQLGASLESLHVSRSYLRGCWTVDWVGCFLGHRMCRLVAETWSAGLSVWRRTKSLLSDVPLGSGCSC